WLWAVAAVAVVVAMIATYDFKPRPVDRPQVVVETPKVASVERPEMVAASTEAPVRESAPRRQPREIVTDFFPLMDVPPPIERAQLVRVSVPASAMRTVGLPVREDRLTDRVQADVLVSEEGLATAVRFVKFQ